MSPEEYPQRLEFQNGYALFFLAIPKRKTRAEQITKTGMIQFGFLVNFLKKMRRCTFTSPYIS